MLNKPERVDIFLGSLKSSADLYVLLRKPIFSINKSTRDRGILTHSSVAAADGRQNCTIVCYIITVTLTDELQLHFKQSQENTKKKRKEKNLRMENCK